MLILAKDFQKCVYLQKCKMLSKLYSYVFFLILKSEYPRAIR